MINKRLINTGVEAAAAFDPLQNFETVTYTGNGSTQKITGYIRKGAAFNGSSSRVSLPSSINTNYITPTGSFSASTWVNFNTIGTAEQQIICFNTTANLELSLNTNSNTGKIVMRIYKSGASPENVYLVSTTTLTANNWYHIAVTYNNGNWVLYINGSSEDTGTQTLTQPTTNIYLGERLNNSQYLNGKLDQVRIFNKALSSSEVTTLYGETYASSTKSTTDIFGDGSGVALYELDEDATDTGGAGTNGYIGDAAFFNGSSSDITLPALGNNYPVSYSAWIYPSPIVASAIINDTLGGNRFLVGLQSSSFSRTNYILVAQGGQAHYGTPTNSVTANTWNHILVVANSVNNYTIYINGVSQTVSNLGGTAGGSASYNIGSSVSTEFFSGRIDDVRIYSDTLTSTEVGYIYNNTTASIPTDNLVAYYKLDGDATDETGTYNGTATNVSYAYDGTATNVNYLGMAFQPDLVWVKGRSIVNDHSLFDSVRTATKRLKSNSTAAEDTLAGGVTSFDSNGFTIGSNYSQSSTTYVAWCFKGGGTAVSNTDGSITSTVSANQDAGFSIVSYTGTGSATNFGHGLSSQPELVIIKRTNAAEDWFVLYDTTNTPPNYMKLNATAAGGTSTSVFPSPATSTVINIGTDTSTNSSGSSYIAYCFHSVDGYQKIGSYTGTGASGNTITTGFRPRFILLRRSNTANNWDIFDSTRDSSTYVSKTLKANSSDAESTYPQGIYFQDNGFEPENTYFNDSGDTIIYLAIA